MRGLLHRNGEHIGGYIMRELTALEIDRFDFTGHIPELNMPTHGNKSAAPAKAQRRVKLRRKMRAPKIGLARTA